MDTATRYVAPRTCTVVDAGGQQQTEEKPMSLTGYAAAAAYVLIAEPGAGKTTAFKAEAATEGAVFVTVVVGHIIS